MKHSLKDVGTLLTTASATTRRALRLASFLALLVAATLPATAQTESVLHSFAGAPDGASPSVGVIRDGNGNLFGATYYGGSFGAGTVFQITPGGSEKVLYTFTGLTDGGGPNGDLMLQADGTLLGTTYFGGSFKNGTVFQLTSTGTETVLYNFTGGSDGALPFGNLIRDSKGNLYGTAEYGGDTNNGTVFELTTAGTMNVLHSFTGGADGGTPLSGLVRDKLGNFYGTTYYGGSAGAGTVFKVTPAGKLTTLYSFKGFKDASYPQSGVVLDSSGNLYGTTITGGTFGSGAVFEILPTGNEKVLYNFKGQPDGFFPAAKLVRDSSGNLYGTTLFGGSSGQGAVFEISASGAESVLYSFTGGADGGTPRAELIRDAQGNLYSTTSAGGTSGLGTVFKLTP